VGAFKGNKDMYLGKDYAYQCAEFVICKGFTNLMWISSSECPQSIKQNYILSPQDIVEIDFTNDLGWTALMISSQNSRNNEQLVQQIINAGANLNKQNKEGSTALIIACRVSDYQSSEKTVEMLINAGADLNIQNRYLCTALNVTCYNYLDKSSERTAEILIKAKADTTIRDYNGYTPLMLCKWNRITKMLNVP
jgi:ankyrin repeat protein